MRPYSHGLATVATRFHQAQKKADEAATPKGFNHVGLLVNRPPGSAGLPFNKSSELEFRDLVGAALTSTLSGADPATELKKAHEQFRPILERSEKA